MTKVWVFTLAVGGVIENIKVVPLDMEKEITQYANEQLADELGVDLGKYPADVDQAWAELASIADESVDIDVALRYVTLGDLSDD